MVFIMGFPDDQNINPVAAAVFYDVPFHGFPTCRAGRRILLDDCEILQAVRKQNLRAVQRVDSREFAIKSRGEAEQHQDKDAGEGPGISPGSADSVQQEQSRRGEKQKNEQQQAEEMCQEIVKPFRKFRLIDRLNGVIGELASVCDVMRNNCQREQIQQETMELMSGMLTEIKAMKQEVELMKNERSNVGPNARNGQYKGTETGRSMENSPAGGTGNKHSDRSSKSR